MWMLESVVTRTRFPGYPSIDFFRNQYTFFAFTRRSQKR